jgi:hypothetical protein
MPLPARSVPADVRASCGYVYLLAAGLGRLCCPVDRSAAVGGGCLSGTVQGIVPGAHQIRPARRPAGSSTVSRRISGLAGFYRTCVIDGVLAHSPAQHVRRPTVPPDSPTLGLTHLQLEALLTAARQFANDCDFALVVMLGRLGLRIFEATSAAIVDLGEEHGHRVLRVVAKGTKTVLVPLPPAVGRAIDRAVAGRTSGPILLNTRGGRMDRHAATRRLRHLARVAGVRLPRMHRTCSGTPSSPPCSTPASISEMCRSPPGTPTRAPPCVTTGAEEPRPAPQLHPRRLHGIGDLTAERGNHAVLPEPAPMSGR